MLVEKMSREFGWGLFIAYSLSLPISWFQKSLWSNLFDPKILHA